MVKIGIEAEDKAPCPAEADIAPQLEQKVAMKELLKILTEHGKDEREKNDMDWREKMAKEKEEWEKRLGKMELLNNTLQANLRSATSNLEKATAKIESLTVLNKAQDVEITRLSKMLLDQKYEDGEEIKELRVEICRLEAVMKCCPSCSKYVDK